MPSSRRKKYVGPGFLWFVVVGNVVMGGFVLVLSVGLLVERDEGTLSVAGCLLGILLGLGWLGFGAFGFYRTYLHLPPADGRRVTTQLVDGSPALAVQWRKTFLVYPLLTLSFLVLVLTGVSVGFLRGDTGAVAWFVVGFTVLLALLIPDALLRAVRDHRLFLTREGMGIRGWEGDAWLDWDDVVSQEFVDAGQYTILRFHGLPGAPSWRWTRRTKIIYAATPRTPWIDVPAVVLDVNPRFFAGIMLFYAHTPSARSEIGQDVSRRRIVEQLDPRT